VEIVVTTTTAETTPIPELGKRTRSHAGRKYCRAEAAPPWLKPTAVEPIAEGRESHLSNCRFVHLPQYLAQL